MQEIIIKKEAVYKTEINTQIFETIYSYIEDNKNNFLERSWDCNIKTSLDISSNILHGVEEFKYLRKIISGKIDDLYIYNTGTTQPFYIESSWINVLENSGYQEFHKHTNAHGSGVLYLTDDSSAIEFAVFPEDTRIKFNPQKGDMLLFDSSTFHRVLESDKERISLAFNFKGEGNA